MRTIWNWMGYLPSGKNRINCDCWLLQHSDTHTHTHAYTIKMTKTIINTYIHCVPSLGNNEILLLYCERAHFYSFNFFSLYTVNNNRTKNQSKTKTQSSISVAQQTWNAECGTHRTHHNKNTRMRVRNGSVSILSSLAQKLY